MCEGAGIKEREMWIKGLFTVFAALLLFLLFIYGMEHCTTDKKWKQHVQQQAEKRDKLCLDLCKAIDAKRLRHDHDRCFCKDANGCITVFSSTNYRLYNNPRTIGKCAEAQE